MTLVKTKDEAAADAAMSLEDRAIDAMRNLQEILEEVSVLAVRTDQPGCSDTMLMGTATALAKEAAKIASSCKSQISEFRNADLKPIKAACKAIGAIGESWKSESGSDTILSSRIGFALAAVGHASDALDHDLSNAMIRSGDRSRDIQRYRSSQESSIAELGQIVHKMDEQAGVKRREPLRETPDQPAS